MSEELASSEKDTLIFSATDRAHAGLRSPIGVLVLLLAAQVATIIATYWDSLRSLTTAWFESPEYNYAPIVPAVAVLMVWKDLQSRGRERSGGWSGVALTLLGLLAGLVAYETRTQSIGQYGLLLAVIGIVVATIGERNALRAWPGLLFLAFSLPMANLVQFELTWALQLAATQGGVALIRLFDVPVFREGNIIDLGGFQLQVAEACSGLRYLFPLSAFSFLCGYLLNAGWLTRSVVFLSALPLTVLMNIVRIAITGLLVSEFGIEAAQGFFHYFEGWAVFCICIALLFIEMKVLCLVDGGGRGLMARLQIELPRFSQLPSIRAVPLPLFVTLALCLLSLGVEILPSARPLPDLTRNEFLSFPHNIGAWTSTEVPIEQQTVVELRNPDLLSRNFTLGAAGEPVNVFVAYYASLGNGATIHSPRACIPAGGWEIEQMSRTPLNTRASGRLVPQEAVRLIIRRGQERQLVYYWFEIGGQSTISEYSAKFDLFMGAITRNRSDGALVRFVTPIAGTDGLAQAEQRISQTIDGLVPLLPEYLP